MCDCYKVGGPWIAEDPECPEHGWRSTQRDDEMQALRDQIDELQKFNNALLFALQDAWPYVQQWCTIQSVKGKIRKLLFDRGVL